MNICLDADLVERELVAESFKVARDVALDLFMSSRWHLTTMTRRAYSSWAEDLCERQLDSRQACVDDSQGRLQDVKDSPRSNVVGQITLIPIVYPNGSDQGNGADPGEYEDLSDSVMTIGCFSFPGGGGVHSQRTEAEHTSYA